MKKEIMDLEATRDNLQRLLDSRFTKVAVATVVIVAIIFVVGQIIRVITMTVVHYNALAGALRTPVIASEISA